MMTVYVRPPVCLSVCLSRAYFCYYTCDLHQICYKYKIKDRVFSVLTNHDDSVVYTMATNCASGAESASYTIALVYACYYAHLVGGIFE